jgi:hypothetical protein
MESMGCHWLKCLGSSNAINGHMELDGLYLEAIGRPAKWHCWWNDAGEIAFPEKHKARPQREAAEVLVRVALSGVALVSLLHARAPELCQEVARTLAERPVSSDPLSDWRRRVQSQMPPVNSRG